MARSFSQKCRLPQKIQTVQLALGQPAIQIPLWRAAGSDAALQSVEAACLLKDWVSPIPSSAPTSGHTPDPLIGKEIDYIYDKGVFHAGDLACGSLFERKKLDGSTCIELTFRGTESTTTGDASTDRRNLIGGYFLSAYKNMQGHYERHRPLVEEAIRVATARSALGEKIELRVSGHLLGGSMAELFIKNDAGRLPPSVKISACTFGSPGIGAPQSAFSMLVKGFARLLLSKTGLVDDNVARTGIWRDYMSKKTDSTPSENALIDRFINPEDPVPKLGMLGGYQGSGRTLLSQYDKFDQTTGKIIESGLSDIANHSSSAYAMTRMHALLDVGRVSHTYRPLFGAQAEAIERIRTSVAKAQAFSASMAERVATLGASALAPHQYQSIADSTLQAAAKREGMISQDLPNARADENAYRESVGKIGSLMMEKLASRRASSAETQLAFTALARVSRAPL
jgi:hypothetical protein